MNANYQSPVIKPHLIRKFSKEELQELARCSNSIFSFCKHVRVLDPIRGIVPFDPYDHQKELLIKFRNHRFNIGLSSRQSGKTTTVAIHALHKAIFQPNQFIGIASNTFEASKDFLSRIKTVYENLPDYLKPGVLSYNVSSILFDNGSKIEAAATTPHTFRGRSISLLIFDEMASVDPASMARELWASVYPTISQGGNIIIISTPMGVGNLFYELWTDAIYKRNNFVTTKVDWDAVPGRDMEWRKRTIEDIGLVRWNREFGNQFIGSTTTVINADTLEQMQNNVPDRGAIEELDTFSGKGSFRVFERVRPGAVYVIGVDVSKGVGQNNSVAQVMRVVPDQGADEEDHEKEYLQQSAVFSTDMISPRQFSQIIFAISRNYNDAYVAVENNAEGFQVADILWNELEYENTINWRPKGAKRRFEPGIKATKQSKEMAITVMKQEVEDNKVQIFDYTTIKELSCYVEDNGKCKGEGSFDDHVAAIYWAIFSWNLYKKGVIAFDIAGLMESMRHTRGKDSETDKRRIRIMRKKDEGRPEDEFLDQEVIASRKKVTDNNNIKRMIKIIKTPSELLEDEDEEMWGLAPIMDSSGDDHTEGGKWQDPDTM